MGSYRYSRIVSCALFGITGVKVDIEVSILPGLSSFEIVGQGDSAVRESRNRVHAAIKNNGYDFPNGRVTVGMAPGFIRKEGTAFDLPIAIGILIASRQIRPPDRPVCITGEMSLKGEIREIPGCINRILTARTENIPHMIIPFCNLAESAGIENIRVYGVRTLEETIRLIGTRQSWPDQPPMKEAPSFHSEFRDISTIIGQPLGVRALEIAAAGKHNLMMIGSPGCGKTSLAAVMPGLMPSLSQEEKIELTRIYSSCGLLKAGESIRNERPFRSPHHNVTLAAMAGGGFYPSPGEITLAHHGVLFLDEMNEFGADVLDMLRQPMEEKKIRITRCRYSMEYPADFILIGAANPCRCGYLLERDPRNPCSCSQLSIQKYFSTISGPILDRMDLYVEMMKVPSKELNRSIQESVLKESTEVRRKVEQAWKTQWDRCIRHHVEPALNSRIPSSLISSVFELTDEVAAFAVNASERMDLSVRGYQKMIRTARTIADYDGDELLAAHHIAQAIQFRKK